METVDFEPRGTKIFFGELMIFKVDVLEMLKIPLEFSSKGCPREVISAARLFATGKESVEMLQLCS